MMDPDLDSSQSGCRVGLCESQALVWSSRLEQEEFFKNKQRKNKHSVAVWGILLQQAPQPPAPLPLPICVALQQ